MRAALPLFSLSSAPLRRRGRGRVGVAVAALLLFEPALAALLLADSVALLQRPAPLLCGAAEDGAPLLAGERLGLEVAATEDGVVCGLGRERRGAGPGRAGLGRGPGFRFGLCASGRGRVCRALLCGGGRGGGRGRRLGRLLRGRGDVLGRG